jgi:glycosyltransferase involved in cell wall biosynthesis
MALIENTLDFEPRDVTAADVQGLRRRLGLVGARVILYTGTLEPYQGLDLLIAAAAEVTHRVPSARFLIVGGTGGQIHDLRELAGGLGVGSRFTFVPAVPPTEVFLYHRLADALVTTRARGTNTPLKIYQYLRAGRPIVATAIRSHMQVLNESCAELVPPEPQGIAIGIARVLNDEEHAHRLAEGARRIAREQYSDDVYLSRLSDLLGRLPAAGGRRSAA